jgi:hypothetical protein
MLKKLKITILAVAALLIGVVSAPAALATTNDDVIATMDAFYSESNALFNGLDWDDGAQVVSVSNAYIVAISETIDNLNALARTSDDSGLSVHIREIANALARQQDIYERIALAFENGATRLDEEIRALITEDQESEQQIAAVIDEYNRYLDSGTDFLYVLYSVLFYVSIGLVLISLGILIDNLRKKDKKHEELFAAAKKLIGSAAVALIGSGITFFWYKAVSERPEGGEYTILYGPILIGYIAFFGGLVQYFRVYLRIKREGANKTAAPAAK